MLAPWPQRSGCSASGDGHTGEPPACLRGPHAGLCASSGRGGLASPSFFAQWTLRRRARRRFHHPVLYSPEECSPVRAPSSLAAARRGCSPPPRRRPRRCVRWVGRAAPGCNFATPARGGDRHCCDGRARRAPTLPPVHIRVRRGPGARGGRGARARRTRWGPARVGGATRLLSPTDRRQRRPAGRPRPTVPATAPRPRLQPLTAPPRHCWLRPCSIRAAGGATRASHPPRRTWPATAPAPRPPAAARPPARPAGAPLPGDGEDEL